MNRLEKRVRRMVKLAFPNISDESFEKKVKEEVRLLREDHKLNKELGL